MLQEEEEEGVLETDLQRFMPFFSAPDLAWRKGIRAAMPSASQQFTFLKEIRPKSNSPPPSPLLPAESRKTRGRTGCAEGGERSDCSQMTPLLS